MDEETKMGVETKVLETIVEERPLRAALVRKLCGGFSPNVGLSPEASS